MTRAIDCFSLHLLQFALLIDVALSQSYCSMQEPVNGRFGQPCLPLAGRVCKFNCYKLDGTTAIPYSSVRVMCTSNLQWSPPAMCDTTGAFVAPGATTSAPSESQFITPKPDAPSPVCPWINPPENGYTEGICVNATVSDVCTFGCLPGFLIEGVTSVVCMGDRWDRQIPQCSQSPCSVTADKITGGKVDDIKCILNPRVGSSCAITCNPGYTTAGGGNKITSQCQQNGWQPPLGQICKTVICQDITQTPFVNGIWTGKCSNGSPGEFCSFSCIKGYSLMGASLASCQSDGSWQYQGDPPRCIAAGENSTEPVGSSTTSAATETPVMATTTGAPSTEAASKASTEGKTEATTAASPAPSTDASPAPSTDASPAPSTDATPVPSTDPSSASSTEAPTEASSGGTTEAAPQATTTAASTEGPSETSSQVASEATGAATSDATPAESNAQLSTEADTQSQETTGANEATDASSDTPAPSDQ